MLVSARSEFIMLVSARSEFIMMVSARSGRASGGSRVQPSAGLGPRRAAAAWPGAALLLLLFLLPWSRTPFVRVSPSRGTCRRRRPSRGSCASLSIRTALLVQYAPPRSSCAQAAASPRPGTSWCLPGSSSRAPAAAMSPRQRPPHWRPLRRRSRSVRPVLSRAPRGSASSTLLVRRVLLASLAA